ncbi:MAG: indole-3-glycerol-phosphate synthase [Pseudomonadota bacterium]
MNDFLADMARGSRARSQAAQSQCSLEDMRVRCQNLPPPTPLTLAQRGMSVIAEIKVRSPAEGQLEAGATIDSVVARAADYVMGGAQVLSVLTEPDKFDGHLDYLAAVKAHVGRQAAVMRKDFLVDEYQLYEARVHGADGVLLIARILSDERLESMLATARALGLFVLLEGFDESDLVRMSPYASEHVLLGVNCRDLTTLNIDPVRFERFIGHFPRGAITVAESGIHSVEQAVALHALGYDAALIGTMLMKADHAGAVIHALGERTRADVHEAARPTKP